MGVNTKDKGKNASKDAQKGKSKGGAKAKKKSWTKVKVKEKLNNAVFLDQKQYERMIKEVPKILCITRASFAKNSRSVVPLPELSSRICTSKALSDQSVLNTPVSTSTWDARPKLLLRKLLLKLKRLLPSKRSKSHEI